jgi:excisionase family DNA binding protein
MVGPAPKSLTLAENTIKNGSLVFVLFVGELAQAKTRICRERCSHPVVVSHDREVSVIERTDEPLRSTTKTAKLLDCSVRTVYRLVERGDLAPIRVGRVLRFEVSEIQRFLDQHRQPVP